MLKNLIDSANISLYKLSKDTGIPYSTLSDLTCGNTLIENTSSNTLYRLAKYFNITMESLYESALLQSTLHIYNEGRDIHVDYSTHKFKYAGPKNLLSFRKINKVVGNTIYMECYFLNSEGEIYVEEDYIDLRDIFAEYGVSFNMSDSIQIDLSNPSKDRKINIIDNSLLVSDSMAISLSSSSASDVNIEIVSINRPSQKMLIRISDYTILSTNMSARMQKRAIDSVKRNISIINDEITGGNSYA